MEWSQQNTPEDYLRKLMVDHFGMHTDDVEKLWLLGLEPPMCNVEWTK